MTTKAKTTEPDVEPDTEPEALPVEPQAAACLAAADGRCVGIVSQADLAIAAGFADLDPSDVGHVVEHISRPRANTWTELKSG